jgi:hypothetical protein
MDIDTNDIDKVLKLFHFHYHLGKHYYDTVGKVIPDRSTQTKILHYLTEQSILEPWGNARDNFILTKNGREIFEMYENHAQYLENEKSSKEEAIKINNARNETILNNAKLSRFQVKSFWYFFYATIVFGLITALSIIYQIAKEPTEQHIERIVQKQIQDLQKSNIIGNHQTSQDTLRQ